ncbi:hypothetical protein CRUP_038556 [Coryphaenoides rupestris]|nr:hypothetical protein CRUP_038556 [Coryphaenoides rupestris]
MTELSGKGALRRRAEEEQQEAAAAAQNPFQMKHMFWLRQNPYGNHENLLLQQENSAVREELLAYRRAGGGSIVENTTAGIDRDLPTLRQMSRDTGVHVVGGAGYYVDSTHTEATRAMTVEQLTDVIVGEVLRGADGTDIRCGVIGEIGTSWPITDSERKVLVATAHAQAQLGCPSSSTRGGTRLRPPRWSGSSRRPGGTSARRSCRTWTACHDLLVLCRTIFDHGELLEFAQHGCYLEYDLFGTEMLNYPYDLTVDMPSDSQRVQA